MFVVEISYPGKSSQIVGPFASFNNASMFTENLIKKIEATKDENIEVSPILYLSMMDGCYGAGFNMDYHPDLPSYIEVKAMTEHSEFVI